MSYLGQLGVAENLLPVFSPPPTIMNATEDSLFSVDLDDYFSDPEGQHLTYSISSFATWLSIDQATGVLYGTPTNADVGGYEIYILASDGETGLGTPFTTILVANTNDAPTDIIGYIQPVPEGAFSPFNAAVFVPVDDDLGDQWSFTLLDDAGGRFELDQFGRLLVRNGSLIDFEAAASHTVRVRMADSGGLSFEKDFLIPVSNVAETPSSLIISNGGNIAENSAPGAFVAQLTGVDPDAGTVLRYSLADSASGLFAIDPDTGVITVIGTWLNFESDASHRILARVTDETGRYLEQTFTIAVSDVNEAPVLLNMISGGTVAENAATGTIVAQLRGGDVDAGEVLTYSLLDNAGGRFTINPVTGVITVANGSLLDFEAASSHTILAAVTDRGGLSYTPYFTFSVTDLADNFITGTSSANRLVGTDIADFISGLAGRDTLFGGNGDDVLIGGAGADQMTGGAGHDTFRFDSIADSPRGGGRDTILDFNAYGLDTLNFDLLDLSRIDANTRIAGDQAFAFIGSTGFSRVAGELRFQSGILSGDVDGDGRADFEIAMTLAGGVPLDSGDFLL